MTTAVNLSMEDKRRSSTMIRQIVKEVTDFSSQYGSETSISYTACNLAGDCNIYPNYGDFTQACVFRTYGSCWKIAPSARRKFKRTPPTFISEDFIELNFEREVYPSKVEIYETYNPGAVVRILACDTSGTDVDLGRIRWQVLWEGDSQWCEHNSRKFSPSLRQTKFKTNLLRLELCHDKCEYYTELDGVYLYGSVELTPSALSAGPADAKDESRDLLMGIRNLSLTSGKEQISVKDEDQSCGPEVKEYIPLYDISTSEAPTSSDNGYFDILPDEVTQLILSYLDIPSLCKASQTSRLLHKHCYDPLQYRELDLQCHWTQVNNKTLESLHSRCQFLQRLNMSWCGGKKGGLTGTAFTRLLQHCGSELRCLYLSSCKFVNSEVLHGIVSNCPNLEELDISSCTQVEGSSFSQISKLRKLQRLNLYRSLIDTNAISQIVRCCKLLRHLNLGSCSRIVEVDDVATLMALNCRDLQTIDFWRCRNLSEKGLLDLSSHCKNLQELDLGWCPELRSHTNCFVNLVQECPRLKKLYLTANRTVCDRDLNAIAKCCPELEQLDILGTRQVTQESALRVLENCPRLRMFDVSFCAMIDFPTVDAWKQQFPHCDIKKSYQDNVDRYR